MATERPAYTMAASLIEQPNWNGYTLQVNVDQRQASIINLKKGGKTAMLTKVVKALEGFEKYVAELNEMKANLDAEIELAKEEAIKEVEARFADRATRIDKVLELVTVTEEVEVPDEDVAEEVVSEEPVVEQPEVQVEPMF